MFLNSATILLLFFYLFDSGLQWSIEYSGTTDKVLTVCEPEKNSSRELVVFAPRQHPLIPSLQNYPHPTTQPVQSAVFKLILAPSNP